MRRTVVSTGTTVLAVLMVALAGCGSGSGGGPSSPPAVSPAHTLDAGASSSAGGAKPIDDQQVETTFPTQQRQPFQAPAELTSKNGVLKTTFNVQPTTFDVAGAQVQGFAYQGNFIGPTLRVHPGDTLRIQVRNGLNEPTNLHSHGMFVSPIGISDNVLRVMKPDTDNDFVLHLPRDVDPGTYWYHTHLHGRVEEQVFAGLSGVLIVDGLTERLPAALQDIPDRVLTLKDLQVKKGAIVRTNIDSNAPHHPDGERPGRPGGRRAHRRDAAAAAGRHGADIWYRLKLDGAQFHVVAEDANPVAEVWTADELLLPPGKRYDVLVRWPTPGTYALRDAPVQHRSRRRRLPATPPRHVRRHRRPGRRRRLAHHDGTGAHRWRPTPSTGPGTWCSARTPPSSSSTARCSTPPRSPTSPKLGTTEEWRIKNTTKEEHPFHIHVNDFEVMSVNGQPYHARSEQDIVPLPPGRRQVVIRMHFNRFLGTYVFHCHILAHEDNGMMGIIDVSPDGKLSKATEDRLKKMNEAMAGLMGMSGPAPGHTMHMG